MAIGPAPLGFAYFAAAKFLGYSGYCLLLNRAISKQERNVPNIWTSGVVRTAIGIAVGIVVGLSFWKLVPRGGWFDHHSCALFLWGLVPVRVLEWCFFLWLRYRRCHLDGKQTVVAIFCGIVTSYVLDAFGIATMLIVPGGAWVC